MTLHLGIYVNSQAPEADDPAAHLQAIVAQVKTAERLGFDSIWAGEHHLTPGFHFLPQLPLLAHLAAFSGTMTLGTNLTLLPLHRPVDIAEQVALIDHACGGRFILTVGQGYRREEFEALGSPYEDRLARFIDGVAVIRRLWTERNVNHDAGWYRLTDATVLPGPSQDGGPPIWIGSTTDRAIKRAGRIGDAFMATPNAASSEVQRQFEVFDQARSEAGLAPATNRGRMLEVYCHADSDRAHELARPHLLTKYEAYASWGLTGSAGDAAHAAGAANEADSFAALAHDRFVIGNPDEVAAGLVAQHRDAGLTHLAMRLSWPGSDPADAMACIELLGTEVLPKVRAELSAAL